MLDKGVDEASAEPRELFSDTLYAELRTLAQHYMRAERPDHTLQPTALVHEAFLRVSAERQNGFGCPSHFKATCALAIRRLLVDHARRAMSGKRGASWSRVTLDDQRFSTALEAPDLLDLNKALEDLRQLDERQADVVELRFFGGLSIPETAEVLDCSTRTVDGDWHMARAWLRRHLESTQGQN